jgi:hypothetical protein
MRPDQVDVGNQSAAVRSVADRVFPVSAPSYLAGALSQVPISGPSVREDPEGHSCIFFPKGNGRPHIQVELRTQRVLVCLELGRFVK